MRSTSLALACAVLGLAACGKEVGRVPFTAAGTGTVTVPLSASDVSFWTDIDIEYQGDASLTYSIDLSQGGSKVATATCNPLGTIHVKTSWVETNLGASHSRSGLGEMSCSAHVATAGNTEVKVALAFGVKPASLSLKKADLVLKQ